MDDLQRKTNNQHYDDESKKYSSSLLLKVDSSENSSSAEYDNDNDDRSNNGHGMECAGKTHFNNDSDDDDDSYNPESSVEPKIKEDMGDFQLFYLNDEIVVPTKRTQFLLTIARTVVPNIMNLETRPPFKEALEKNIIAKNAIKATNDLILKEIVHRNIKVKDVHNTKIQQLFRLLQLHPLTDKRDIHFIFHRFKMHCTAIEGKIRTSAQKTENAKSCASYITLSDRLWVILAFEDEIILKAYAKSQKTLSKAELDAMRSEKRLPDFFDLIAQKFNNASWLPVTEVLPDLHDTFTKPIPCPKRNGCNMTRDKAKQLMSAQRYKLQEIIYKYKKSGNGSGQLQEQMDSDNQNSSAEIDGNDRSNFLGDGCPSLLYWWHVLEEKNLIQFTCAKFNGVGANSDSAPSVASSSRKKAKYEHKPAPMQGYQMKIAETVAEVGKSLQEQNKIAKHERVFKVKEEIEKLEDKKFNLMKDMVGIENVELRGLYQQRIDSVQESIDWNKQKLEKIVQEMNNVEQSNTLHSGNRLTSANNSRLAHGSPKASSQNNTEIFSELSDCE